MTEEPRVSVVLPTHNRADLLPRAMDSVLGQTFRDFELIVVDDASRDRTPAIVESVDDERVKSVRFEENHGDAHARNAGIEMALGTYLAFIDDDDLWRPTKLEKQVDLMDSTPPRVALVYCWMDQYVGDEMVQSVHPTLRGDIFREMLDRNAITNSSTLLVRRSVAEELGGFDPSIPRGTDSDFIRRLAREYHVDYVPEVLVEYDVGHEQDRYTTWDQSGVRAAIESTERKFEKFPEAFEAYPEMYASNLAYIGTNYGILGEWNTAFEYYARALRADPTTWRTPFQALRLGKFYLDRYLPTFGRLIGRLLRR